MTWHQYQYLRPFTEEDHKRWPSDYSPGLLPMKAIVKNSVVIVKQTTYPGRAVHVVINGTEYYRHPIHMNACLVADAWCNGHMS